MSTGSDQFEREFAAFLAEEESRVAALYRKLPQPEPDARLDAAVKSMAHRALNPQLVATPRIDEAPRRRGRWLPALGAAAGVVFAAGIAFKMVPALRQARDEYGGPASEVISVRSIDAPAAPVEPPLSPPFPQQQPASSASKPAAAAAPAPAAVAPERAHRLLERGSLSERKAPAEAPAETGARDDSSSRLQAEQTPPAAAPARAFPGTPRARTRASSAADAVERRQMMAEGAWQNLHDRNVADEREAAAKSTSQETPRHNAAGAAAPLRGEPAPLAIVAPQPAAPTPLAPARARTGQEPDAGVEQERLRSSPAPASGAASADSVGNGPEPPGAKRAPAAAAAMAAAAANDAAAQMRARASHDPNARLYPESWLANIRTLLRDKRRDDALRSLAEFRRLYPDYPLPDDLRKLK